MGCRSLGCRSGSQVIKHGRFQRRQLQLLIEQHKVPLVGVWDHSLPILTPAQVRRQVQRHLASGGDRGNSGGGGDGDHDKGDGGGAVSVAYGPAHYFNQVLLKTPFIKLCAFVSPEQLAQATVAQRMRHVAGEYRGQLNMAVVDGINFAAATSHYSVHASEVLPQVRAWDQIAGKFYRSTEADPVSVAGLRAFASDLVTGGATPMLRSEPRPVRRPRLSAPLKLLCDYSPRNRW